MGLLPNPKHLATTADFGWYCSQFYTIPVDRFIAESSLVKIIKG